MATTLSGAGTTPIPTPTQGNGPFGLVPGPVTVPNPAGDLSSPYPNLSPTNTALSGDIYNKLLGYLSPSTLNAIQNKYGADFGVASGMPGSGLSWNNVYGNIIGASENQRQQGIQDYNATIPTVSGTQTVSPALQTQIQESNALNAAAPNPQAAQTYAQQLFNSYLASMRGPAGGTSGRGFDVTGGLWQGFGVSPTSTQALGFGFGTQGPTSTSSSGQDGYSQFTGYDPNSDIFNFGPDSGTFSSDMPSSFDDQYLSDIGGYF